ncbi:MAG TPA: hypothetical protein VFU02_12490 [Polyangiaceae bacterium]|nr:hypothetical protein [Polyangiaceae bacterium]
MLLASARVVMVANVRQVGAPGIVIHGLKTEELDGPTVASGASARSSLSR